MSLGEKGAGTCKRENFYGGEQRVINTNDRLRREDERIRNRKRKKWQKLGRHVGFISWGVFFSRPIIFKLVERVRQDKRKSRRRELIDLFSIHTIVFLWDEKKNICVNCPPHN